MATHGENVVKLQSLSEKHKQVAALLAQGLGRTDIAAIVDFTPEYVTWLSRDPLFKLHLQQMSDFVNTRLEAMYDRVADAVDEGLSSGSVDDKMKAARLQLEVTGRIGKGSQRNAGDDSGDDRLKQLADRLVAVLGAVRKGETYENPAQDVEEATYSEGREVPGQGLIQDQSTAGAV